MDELDRLVAQAERIALTGERLSLSFALELAQVWRQYERAVLTVIGTVVPSSPLDLLRSRVRQLLNESGYDALAVAVSQAGVEQMARVVLGSAEIARAELQVRLDALRRMAAEDLFAQGDWTSTAVWRALTQSLLGDAPMAQIRKGLADALDRTEAGVRTLFDTQVSILGRQVEAIKSQDLPEDQPYLFAGPVDQKTRLFCLERVGKVFTRAEINAMDNEQIPNVFITAGGFNCRHSFLAVESQALRALSGTGKAVDVYKADIARAEAYHASKRRKAA